MGEKGGLQEGDILFVSKWEFLRGIFLRDAKHLDKGGPKTRPRPYIYIYIYIWGLGSGSGRWWGGAFLWKITEKGKGVGKVGGGVGISKGTGKSMRKLGRNYPLANYP